MFQFLAHASGYHRSLSTPPDAYAARLTGAGKG